MGATSLRGRHWILTISSSRTCFGTSVDEIAVRVVGTALAASSLCTIRPSASSSMSLPAHIERRLYRIRRQLLNGEEEREKTSLKRTFKLDLSELNCCQADCFLIRQRVKNTDGKDAFSPFISAVIHTYTPVRITVIRTEGFGYSHRGHRSGGS
jgi:hypothetical protein